MNRQLVFSYHDARGVVVISDGKVQSGLDDRTARPQVVLVRVHPNLTPTPLS